MLSADRIEVSVRRARGLRAIIRIVGSRRSAGNVNPDPEALQGINLREYWSLISKRTATRPKEVGPSIPDAYDRLPDERSITNHSADS